MNLKEGDLAVGITCKDAGISEQTYYRWRQEDGRSRLDQASRLRDLEKGNQLLKELVADLALDKAIREEVSRGNF